MIEGTLREPTPWKFSRTFEGATILRLEQRAHNVFAVCCRTPDGGLSDFVLHAVVPYKEPSGATFDIAVITNPRNI